MAFCHQCGASLNDGARFCGQCGAAVQAETKSVERPILSGDTPGVPPYRPAPASGSGRAGMGAVLPVLILIAILAIGYLVFAQSRTKQGVTDTEVAATGDDRPDAIGSAGSGGARYEERAVDRASDAAAIASEGVRSSGSAVPASALDAAFFRDPDGAAIRYAGPIRVSGTIASMVQPGSTPALSMEGRTRFNYMVVNFPAGYRQQLAPLAKGQYITIACDDVRGLGGTTILSGCLLT